MWVSASLPRSTSRGIMMDRVEVDALHSDARLQTWLVRCSPIVVLTVTSASAWLSLLWGGQPHANTAAIPVILGFLGIYFFTPVKSEADPERVTVISQLTASAVALVLSVWYLFVPAPAWLWLAPAVALVVQQMSPSLVTNMRIRNAHLASMSLGMLLFIIGAWSAGEAPSTNVHVAGYLASVATAFTLVIVTKFHTSRLALTKHAERIREIGKLTEAAERANETAQYIVASVSHEMRTPLTSVLGFTQMSRRILREVIIPTLSDDPAVLRKAKRAEDNLRIAETEAQRMASIVNVLLDQRELVSGAVEWGNEPFQSREVITSAVMAMLGVLPNPPPFKFKVDVPSILPSIRGDRDRIRECVIEILSNAVKFTPSGLVSISAGTDRNEVWIRVEDSGVGIAPENIDNVFEPFNQAKQLANADKPDGTGLGLAFVKSVIEGHRGRIVLTSKPQEGTTCTIWLPVADTATDPRETSSASMSIAAGPSPQRATRRVSRTSGTLRRPAEESWSDQSGSWDVDRISRDLASNAEVVIIDEHYAATHSAEQDPEEPLPNADPHEVEESGEEDISDMPTFEFDLSAPPLLVTDEDRPLATAWRQALLQSGVNAVIVPPAQLLSIVRFWLQQPTVLTLTIVLGDCGSELDPIIVRGLDEINDESGRLAVMSISQRTSDERRQSNSMLMLYQKPISTQELVRLMKRG